MAEAGHPLTPEDEQEEDISSRHKREIKELRAKIQALKKSISKGDKKRKKEVSIEIAKLEQEIQEKQQSDFSSEVAETFNNGGDVIEISEQLSNTDLGIDGHQRKSKAQKRKEKKAKKDKERDERIAQGDVEAKESARFQEKSKLLSLLQPLGFCIKDIHPDGNCLYAAISDQLALRHQKEVSVQELRKQCSVYIQSNPDQFVPFITDKDTGGTCTPEYFNNYCHNIEHTATWGGEIELVALSHVYHLPISVFQSEAPTIFIGNDEYPENGMIYLSYHQFEYSLGRHYNSVINSQQ